MKLVFVRHGETDFNLEQKIQGRVNNPLNETGRIQAEELGILLSKSKTKWQILGASLLSRSLETAQIIAQQIQYTKPILVLPLFVERDFGELEGTFIPDVKQFVYDENYTGPGYETNLEIKWRVAEGILDLYTKYPNNNVLIVAHSHVIKSLISILEDNIRNFGEIEVLNGEPYNFNINKKNAIKIYDFLINEN